MFHIIPRDKSEMYENFLFFFLNYIKIDLYIDLYIFAT